MDAKDRSIDDMRDPSTIMGPVLGTVLFAIARGVPMDAITAVTGLTPASLGDPNARPSEQVLPRLWRLLSERFPGEALALEMAAAAPAELFGVVAHAAQYADDLRSALLLFIRYRAVLSSQLSLTLQEGPTEARLELHHPADHDDDGHASELGIAFASRIFSEHLGGLEDKQGLVRVEFSHAPFGPVDAYTAFFRTPVLFNAPSNAMVFRLEALDVPLARRNASLLAFVQGHLEVTRERLIQSSDNAAVAALRGAICRNAERSEYGARPLAKRLGVSLRTLQRQVRAQGLSLQGLIDETREANARELLQDGRLSLAEIAFLLGYATENSFTRAFRRWTGSTPAQVRRSRSSAAQPSSSSGVTT